MAAKPQTRDLTDTIFVTRGGLANFWGHRVGRLYLTKDRLILRHPKSGEVIGQAELIEIERVERVRHWTIWYVLFGLGLLNLYIMIIPFFVFQYMTIHLVDGTSQKLWVYRRRKMLGHLSTAISESGRKTAAAPEKPPSPAASPSQIMTPPSLEQAKAMLDSLEQLARLRDQGVLTQDEFAQQKKTILRAA